MKRIFKVVGIVSLLTCVSNAYANDLTVTIDNIRAVKGDLVIEVMDKAFYDNDEGNNSQVNKVKVSNHKHTVVFNSIEKGEYIVLVYQDLNVNGEPDFSFFSGPVEPVGASNNAKFNMGPPAWEKAKIVKGLEDKAIEISLFHND